MSRINFEIDPEAQREADAAHQAHLREQQEAYRDRNAWLGFYRACAQEPCRRAQACLGDGKVCFDRWWPHTHPQMKALIRAFLTALREDVPIEEARRRAAAAADEWERCFLAGEFADEAQAFLAGPLAKLPLFG